MFHIVEAGAMQNLHVVPKDDVAAESASSLSSSVRHIIQWCVGIVALFGLGTWLVWWGASVQRTFMLEDIRSACQRLMPETVDRCVDTVIIQRGGARR